MEERLSAAGGELLAAVRDGVATVTLNRPRALNALSLGMIEGLAAWLDAWESDGRVRVVALRGAGDKAFCAGGDVRALRDDILGGRHGHVDFFRIEYALDYRIHTYPKPIVAVMDGIAMGGGMGLGQGASLRIVGDGTRMAMPETAIGLFPDVGGSYFLSRMPGELGTYAGLVGPTFDACDALYGGLADTYLAPEPMARLDATLAEAGATANPRAALRELIPPHEDGMMPGCELARLRPAIDRHFAHDEVEPILRSLREEVDPAFRDWARRTLERLERCSPTMLEVTLRQLRRGATLPLADCFRMELNLVHGCFEQGDFLEGIRAVVVEKDQAPRWKPPSLDQVTPEAVARFFHPRWTPAEHPLAAL